MWLHCRVSPNVLQRPQFCIGKGSFVTPEGIFPAFAGGLKQVFDRSVKFAMHSGAKMTSDGVQLGFKLCQIDKSNRHKYDHCHLHIILCDRCKLSRFEELVSSMWLLQLYAKRQVAAAEPGAC